MTRWPARVVYIELVLGGFCFLACSGAPSEVSTEGDDDANAARYAGRGFAVKILAGVLKAPSTADYPWDSVSAESLPTITEGGKSCQRWLVTGSVDAQNSFGAKLRSRWTVTVGLMDENLFPMKVTLDGDRVYGRDWGDSPIVQERATPEEKPAEKPADEPEAKPEPKPEAVGQAGPKPPEDPGQFRTWTDDTGKHTVEAEFGGYGVGKVKLKKRDGSVLELPLEKLSAADQEWIRERARANR